MFWITEKEVCEKNLYSISPKKVIANFFFIIFWNVCKNQSAAIWNILSATGICKNAACCRNSACCRNAECWRKYQFLTTFVQLNGEFHLCSKWFYVVPLWWIYWDASSEWFHVVPSWWIYRDAGTWFHVVPWWMYWDASTEWFVLFIKFHFIKHLNEYIGMQFSVVSLKACIKVRQTFLSNGGKHFYQTSANIFITYFWDSSGTYQCLQHYFKQVEMNCKMLIYFVNCLDFGDCLNDSAWISKQWRILLKYVYLSCKMSNSCDLFSKYKHFWSQLETV